MHSNSLVARIVILLTLSSALVTGCDASGAEPSDQSEVALRTAEQERYDREFGAAACTCERRLFGPTGGFSSTTLDTELAELGRDRNANRFQCASVVDVSQIERMATSRTECGQGPGLGESTVTQTIAQGLCRSDFNHCISNELRLAAQSSSLTTSTALRDRLLQRAISRAGASAVEALAALAWYSDRCSGSGLTSAQTFQCLRLITSGVENYYARVLDNANRIEEMGAARAELLSHAAAATNPAAFPTREEFHQALWQGDGAMLGPARALLGSGVVSSWTLDDHNTSSAGFDWVVPGLAERGDAAVRAAQLLVDHAVPNGPSRVGNDPIVWGNLADALGVAEESVASLVYNFLDHRIAAQRLMGPYSHLAMDASAALPQLPGADLRTHAPLSVSRFLELGGQSLSGANSPLRSQFGLLPGDVSAALQLTRQVQETAIGSRAYAVVVAEEDGPTLLAARIRAEGLTSPRTLTNALQRVQVGSFRSVDLLRRGMRPTSRTGQRVTTELYEPTIGLAADRFDSYGAAQVLHQVRVHLLRASNVGGFLSDALAGAAVDAPIESQTGSMWTELTTDIAATCTVNAAAPWYSSCVNCGCGPSEFTGNVATTNGLYRVVVSDESPLSDHISENGLVFSRDRDTAHCLAASDDSCPVVPRTAPFRTRSISGYKVIEFLIQHRSASGPPPATQPIYDQPGPDTDSRLFVLIGGVAGLDGRTEIMDVVYPVGGPAVHLLNGTMVDSATQVYSGDPWRLGRPLVDPLGIPTDFVPPLENELSGTTARDLDTSVATYLTDAADSVEQASMLLTAAQQDELRNLQDDLSDAAVTEQALRTIRLDLASLCGEDWETTRCRLARTTVQLSDLISADAPSSPPPIWEGESCDEFLTDVHLKFDLPVSQAAWPQYLRDFFGTAIQCASHDVASSVASGQLLGFPNEVADALVQGQPADFAGHGGREREIMIGLHDLVEDSRAAMGRYRTTEQTSLTVLESLADHAEYLENEGNRLQALCMAANSLGAISSSLQLVAGAVAQGTPPPATGNPDADQVAALQSDLGKDAGLRKAGYEVGKSYRTSSFNGDFRFATDQIIGWTNTTRQTIAVASCGAGGNQSGQSVQQSFANLLNQLLELRQTAMQLRALVSDAALAAEQLTGIENEVASATAHLDLQSRIANSNSRSDVPSYRALNSFANRRATNAMARAQQSLVIARRAIEYRTGQNLDDLSDDEAFTPAPRLWANDVYGVGLGLTDDPVAASRDLDRYLTLLNDYVLGYAFTRRYASGQDSQVLSVRELTIGDRDDDLRRVLNFKCFGDEAIVSSITPGFDIARPCGAAGVEYAEIGFQIPLELEGYVADRLASGNFNYRHNEVAVNVVGAAVFDCSRSPRPYECYGDGTIQYEIHHGDFVGIEDFDGRTRFIDAGPGRIRGGRALAAERVLSTPVLASDRTLLAPYSEAALQGRPLSGTYSIRLRGGPEVRWEQVEDVQVLFNYYYWTRQR